MGWFVMKLVHGFSVVLPHSRNSKRSIPHYMYALILNSRQSLGWFEMGTSLFHQNSVARIHTSGQYQKVHNATGFCEVVQRCVSEVHKQLLQHNLIMHVSSAMSPIPPDDTYFHVSVYRIASFLPWRDLWTLMSSHSVPLLCIGIWKMNRSGKRQ